MNKIITAETVSPGHPDKIADLISDSVLTEALLNNKSSKVAVETFITGTDKGGLVVVGGEISEIAKINNEKVKTAIKKVTHLQHKNINKWIEVNPNWEDKSELQDEYLKLIKKCTDDINENKVIKKLCASAIPLAVGKV